MIALYGKKVHQFAFENPQLWVAAAKTVIYSAYKLMI